MRLVLLVLALFLITGSALGKPAVKELSAAEAEALQRQFFSHQMPDLHKVYVAKLKVDGRPVDITSLHASVISRMGNPTDAPATSVRFLKDHSAIEFLTRDPAGGPGEERLIPLNAPPKSFVFPVISQGRVRPAKIEILGITHKP